MFFLAHLLKHHSGGRLADGISCTRAHCKIPSPTAQLSVLSGNPDCALLSPAKAFSSMNLAEGKASQGSGAAGSCLKAETQEVIAVRCLGRGMREIRQGIRRSQTRHFHIPSSLNGLKWSCWTQANHGPCSRSFLKTTYQLSPSHLLCTFFQ